MAEGNFYNLNIGNSDSAGEFEVVDPKNNSIMM